MNTLNFAPRAYESWNHILASKDRLIQPFNGSFDQLERDGTIGQAIRYDDRSMLIEIRLPGVDDIGYLIYQPPYAEIIRIDALGILAA